MNMVQADNGSTHSSGGRSEQRPLSAIVKPLKGNSDKHSMKPHQLPSDKSIVINQQIPITSADGLAAPARQLGKAIKTIRVLTYNINALEDRDMSASCEKRISRFGQMVANNGIAPEEPALPGDLPRDYDIVAVQEYWRNVIKPGFESCNNDPLLESITSPPKVSGITPTRKYLNKGNLDRQLLFKPDENKYDLYFFDADGGLGTFTLHNISKNEVWSWDKPDLKCVRQGFTFTRIHISDDLEIDVYNVHLCSTPSVSDHTNELQQLARAISLKSRHSGNPVLVMGDFNIYSTEYDSIMQVLGNPRDIWLEARAESNDPGLTTLLDLRKDYIFLMTDPKYVNSRYHLHPTVAKVVQWTMPNSKAHISDHFGVEVQFEIIERP
jgi:endonuclease/exonuclease/phosphatase family metal-dependent hydrolase